MHTPSRLSPPEGLRLVAWLGLSALVTIGHLLRGVGRQVVADVSLVTKERR